MAVNRQFELDALLDGFVRAGRRPRLLLQSCCGPCSSYVLDYLSRFLDITVLFYNPNIWPPAEYEKRLDTQRQLLRAASFPGVTLRPASYDPRVFFAAAAGLEQAPEGGSRCAVCFRLRLEETAKQAAAGGFDFFGTTLTVSPHKNAALINAIGQDAADKYGVRWLPSDFKKRGGYLASIRLSRTYGLYRQNYCGCKFSLSAEAQPEENEKGCVL